jgi:hypothetical protein
MTSPYLLQLLAQSHAEAWVVYGTDLCELVDVLQEYAEQTGVVAAIGQDAVQAIIAAPFALARVEPEEAPPLQAELEPQRFAREYSTPQATVDAFWHVVRLDDERQLTEWLAQHPLDVPRLHELWKHQCPTA